MAPLFDQEPLKLADHIPNPERWTNEEIVSDMELFKIFAGVENEIRDERLLEGDLSTRRARIASLLANGILVRNPASNAPVDPS